MGQPRPEKRSWAMLGLGTQTCARKEEKCTWSKFSYR